MAEKPESRRPGHGPFAAMAGAYFLGNFNDNFYKQAVMLLAVGAGRKGLQGVAGVAFTLPFVLFAAPAGWCADRFPKRSVVIAAKVLEVLAALVGAVGIIRGNLALMLGMVFLMGLQSTAFSPALNGTVPELYPAERVTHTNALLRMIVTAGILAGISLSGCCLDLRGAPIFGAPRGLGMVGCAVVLFSIIGLAVSLDIPQRPAADPGRPFPWHGPLDTVRQLRDIWRDVPLGRILVADVFIWAVGVFQLLVINALGKEQFGLGDTRTSLMVASQLLGIAAGGMLAAQLARGSRWFRVLVPAGFAMALAMGMTALVPTLPLHVQVPFLYLLVGFGGAAGGLFLVPCESFLQIRPPAERKGAVWASANCASFLGMAVASAAYIPLRSIRPTATYGALGAATLGFTLWLLAELRGPRWR